MMLLPMALLQVLANFFRFLEWHYFLGVISARQKISLLDSAVIFVSGFTMTVSPGKAAELLKAVFLKMKTDVPIARSAPIVIAERVVDALAVIAILAATLLITGQRLDLGTYYDLSRTIVFTTAAILAFCLIAVQIRPLAELVLALIARIPLARRFHDWFVHLYESSRDIFQIRHVIPTTAMGVGVYLSTTLCFALIVATFGIELTPILFMQLLFMVGISSAIGALSFVPNGAGVTEITNAAMLMAIVAPTNPTMTLGIATAAALLQGFFHKWFRVVVGLLTLIGFRERLFTVGIEAEIAQAEQDMQGKVYSVEQR
jgi:uncharacterized membrane protein YbhN (UPF0104 family)